MVRLYDPALVVLGGSLAVSLLPYVAPAYSEAQWNLHDDLASVKIVLASCEQPGVVGAALAAYTDARD